MPHLPPAHHETSKRDSPNETKIKEKQNKTIPDSNSNLTKSMAHHNQTKELTTWFLSCLGRGHAKETCEVELLCDIYESHAHVRARCPAYKKAIKSFEMTCGYGIDGLGFYYIPHASSIKNKGDTKATIIRVIEGTMTGSQVTAKMERLVPGKGKWVVEEVRNNTFKTFFPS
jgi:hypothetical protein